MLNFSILVDVIAFLWHYNVCKPIKCPPVLHAAQSLLRTILSASAAYAAWLPSGHPAFYTAAIRLSLAALSSPALHQVHICPTSFKNAFDPFGFVMWRTHVLVGAFLQTAGQALAALCTVGSEQLSQTGMPKGYKVRSSTSTRFFAHNIRGKFTWENVTTPLH